MYLRDSHLENVGPIKCLDLTMPFNADAMPQPIVIVGTNGSGKTIFLSYVADALTEFAKQAYSDIVSGQTVVQMPYLRYVAPTNQRLDAEFGLTLLKFSLNEKAFLYLEKTGKLTWEERANDLGERFLGVAELFTRGIQEMGERQFKVVSIDKPQFEKVFLDEVMCYFPPSRKESPHWLNPDSISGHVDFAIPARFSGRLDKPIFVESSAAKNKQWLLDVVLDSRIDLNIDRESPRFQEHIRNADLLRQGRQRVDKLLQAILQNPNAQIMASHRADAYRLYIGAPDTRILVPSFDHLSSGQSILFNLFATIIRYSEKTNLTRSFTLSDIEGIVLIDEIDAHLHSDLQYNVLPELIRLFPRVQFIVTSHAPLFLLGMERTFGSGGFKLIEMPGGSEITTERFTEFQHSFEYYKLTKAFEEELTDALAPLTRPIVITEGKSDAILLRTAWNKLFPGQPMIFDVIASGIAFQETEQEGSAETVRRMLEFLPRVSQQPIVGIFDNDREGNQQFKGLNKRCFELFDITRASRKHLNSRVWGLLLPVPPSRQSFVTVDDANQRYLSIEHYFPDDLLYKERMYGKKILGTEVFEICGDKVRFANESISFDPSLFESFRPLFDEILRLIASP